MQHRAIVSSILAAGSLTAALVSGACRDSTTPPAGETQTQTSQQTNIPMTVAGCLKAGEAAGTFVLTAARAEGQGETATYQLVGDASQNLQDQIGRQVEVTGTVNAQQEIAATGARVPTDKEERPAGTSGTPTVQTKTEIDIKRLSVSSVKPLGDKCDM